MLMSVRVISRAASCRRRLALLDASGCLRRIPGSTPLKNQQLPALSCLVSSRWFSSNTRIPEVEHFENVDKRGKVIRLRGQESIGALLQGAVASAKTSATTVNNIDGNLSYKKVILKRKAGRRSKLAPEVVYTLPEKRERAKWTAQADEALKAAVAVYGSESWQTVALHMGSAYSFTGQQCSRRWHTHVRFHAVEGILAGPWSTDEMRRLEELIPQHMGSAGRVHWGAIGAALNRMPAHCYNTWRLLKSTTMKKGSFSAGEDALIMRRVEQWGDTKERGLWVALEEEMGRTESAIRSRWTYTLQRRLNAASKLSDGPNEHLKMARSVSFAKKFRAKWTEEMDEALKEGVALYKETVGWDRVAEHVGRGVTIYQCVSRWLRSIDVRGGEKLKQEPWTEEEVVRLEQLVPLHITTPYTSETLGTVVSKPTYDWVAIGKLLNRNKDHCRTKWERLQSSRMKKGRFSSDEDALITRRVAEWGDKGRGLWVSLKKELGRPRCTIQTRWQKIKARV